MVAFARTMMYLTVAAFCVTATFVAVGLYRAVGREVEEAGGVSYLADNALRGFVDGLVESGVFESPRGGSAFDRSDPLLAQRVIVVTHGMNEGVARSVVEKLLYLDSIDHEKPIDLYLSTSGGWLDAAFAIVDTMRAIRAPVNTIATGGCYSAGTVVLAAGTGRRVATPSAVLSVHVNDYQSDGEFSADEQDLKRFRRLYLESTRAPEEWFSTPGDNQYYLDAAQALEIGLVDELAEPAHKPPPRPARGRPPGRRDAA